jgi:hypothetical protein
MTPEQVEKRSQELMAIEAAFPERYFFLSFAERKPPHGRGFLGGTFVKARGVATAHDEATKRGLNPGGSVEFTGLLEGLEIPERYANRLFTTHEECDKVFDDLDKIFKGGSYGSRYVSDR